MVYLHVDVAGGAACHFRHDDAVLFTSAWLADEAERMPLTATETSG